MRIAAEAALASVAAPVIVVTGHEAAAIEAALAGLAVAFAHNPDYRAGPVDLAAAPASRRFPPASTASW